MEEIESYNNDKDYWSMMADDIIYKIKKQITDL